MFRVFLALAGFFGSTGVILGSYSAHGLTKVLSPEKIVIFKMGVQYQMYHAIALLGIAILTKLYSSKLVNATGWLFTIGILFFAGTMYSITYLGLPNIGTAPIGGVAFIVGWFLLCIAAWQAPAK